MRQNLLIELNSLNNNRKLLSFCYILTFLKTREILHKKFLNLFQPFYQGFRIAPTEIPKWLKEAKEYDYSDIKEGIRLHLNESPYSPPSFVIQAVEKYLSQGNRYQHPDLTSRFKELAAEYNKVEPSNIFPTPGGDGALRATFYNFLNPGDQVAYNFPSYSMYSVYSAVRGLKVNKVNLIENGDWWKEDLDKLLDYAKDSKLVIIDDPNNPTGSPMLKANKEIISTLAENIKGFLVLDEAYYEFSGYTAASLVNEYPNVMIVRTLSKAFSLASYRVGYLIANKEVVNALTKTSTPFDVALPSLIAGITALENSSYAKNIVNEITENREYLYSSLKRLGLKVYKSVTNFLLIKDNRDLLTPLMERKIAIRKPLDGFYRITVGTKEQCEILVKALGEILESGNSK
ncbi:histidinol-phosphate transaminase [Acidianus sp. HS-5]|nr:histidinol-phosphate transaminase [Acidianus sp. HS-5]